MRRTGEAEEQIQRTLALDRNYAHGYMMLGMVRLQAGDPRAAIASMRRATELGDFYPHVSGILGSAYAASGDRAAALDVLADLTKRSKNEYIPAFAFAVIYASLGDTEQGLKSLQRGIAERDVFLAENFFDPLLGPLRKEPEFAKIERAMGLRR